MTPRNDVEAIAASLSEPRAFVEVFDRHYDVIHAYLRRRVGKELADELASGKRPIQLVARDRDGAEVAREKIGQTAFAPNSAIWSGGDVSP